MAFHGRSFKDLFESSLFYKLDKFCDVVIIAQNGVPFKVHKFFLSKGSEYFNAFFRNDVGEKDTVTLEFNSDILENILIFLYTGELYIDDNNVTTLIVAADFLLIDALLMHCRHFVLKKISLNCCISLLAVSYFVERLQITEHCFRFVQVHFGSLVHKNDPHIAELPLHIFRDLLKDDSLGVYDESTVWKAIMIWIEGNAATSENVAELASCVRWNVVNYSVTSHIGIHPTIKNNASCRSMDLEELIQKCRNEVGESSQFMLTTSRCPQKMYIFACRKFSSYSEGILEIFLTYDGQLDIWRKIGETNVYFHALIVMDGLVYMFNTTSNEMKTFDVIKKRWLNKRDMRSSRQSYYVVRNQSFIFAIGGFVLRSETQLPAVEYYDPSTDVWSYSAPIPSINICGASVVNEKLYVIGYVEDFEILEMRAYVYDNDIWSNIGKPKQFRTSFAILNFQERLHIFGGRTKELAVTTLVEVYCPEEDEWKIFPALPFPYEQPHAVVLRDKLMVYDDCPGIHSVPRFSPCTWNEGTQLWDVEDVFSPFNEIHRYEFCCIDDRHILHELARENRDPETVWIKTPFVKS